MIPLLSILSILAGIYIVAKTLHDYRHIFHSQKREKIRSFLWMEYSPYIAEAIFRGNENEWKDLWWEFDWRAKYEEAPCRHQIGVRWSAVVA